MEADLNRIQSEALAETHAAGDLRALESVRVKYLGRSGDIPRLSEGMKSLSKEERPRFGRLLNEVRTAVTAALDVRAAALESERDAASLAGLDPTLPGNHAFRGTLHPLTQLQDRAIQILRHMGFVLADGPDIETEWHCFDALNTPPDHPARNEGDTFYLPDGRLLRSQTSTVQIRTMCAQRPPLRIIAPGACYRRDEVDATHLSQFNQIEGLYVDENVSLADLKSAVEMFVRGIFGEDAEIRLRPHFFPFTEPSYEVDVRAAALGGKWLEMAGCGMVDPAVFERVNEVRGDDAYDPERVTGFAFGFGLDRLAMCMSALPDIRLLIENDLRFLAQFPR